MNEENFNQFDAEVMKPKSSPKIKTQKSIIRRIFSKSILLLLVGIALGWSVGYVQYGFNQSAISPAVTAKQVEEQKLLTQYIANIGKMMVLPAGEEPIIATITDAKALAKDQVFYSDAKNGDIVLVYQKAMKAIIYNPTKNIIVNVGPVFYQNQATATSTASSTIKNN